VPERARPGVTPSPVDGDIPLDHTSYDVPMSVRSRWVSAGRGARGSLLIVTMVRLAPLAHELGRGGYFAMVCGPDVASRAASQFRFDALVLMSDLSTLDCARIRDALERTAGVPSILHGWTDYPGGLDALVAEHVQRRRSPRIDVVVRPEGAAATRWSASA
jgi:hypothetical protein